MGFDEPPFGLAKLSFEVANATVKRSQVLVGRQAESARNPPYLAFDRAFEPPASPQHPDRSALRARVSHQFGEAPILHEPEPALLQPIHGTNES